MGIRIGEFQTKAWNLIYPTILNYIKMINYIKLYYYIISILSSGNTFSTKILQERYLDSFSGQIMDILAYKAVGEAGRCYLPIDIDFFLTKRQYRTSYQFCHERNLTYHKYWPWLTIYSFLILKEIIAHFHVSTKPLAAEFMEWKSQTWLEHDLILSGANIPGIVVI